MMLKFTKLSENASKVIYNIMNGIFGTAEYDKGKKSVKFFDSNGKEFNEIDYKIAFSKIVENNFPNEYIFAAG